MTITPDLALTGFWERLIEDFTAFEYENLGHGYQATRPLVWQLTPQGM